MIIHIYKISQNRGLCHPSYHTRTHKGKSAKDMPDDNHLQANTIRSEFSSGTGKEPGSVLFSVFRSEQLYPIAIGVLDEIYSH